MLASLLAACLLAVALQATPAAIARPPAQDAAPQAAAPVPDYAFRSDRSRALQVVLDGDRPTYALAWPDTGKPAWTTALLAVEIATSAPPSPSGPDRHAADPYVEIVAGGYRDRQYFRAGDQGPRWLNLSHLQGAVAPGSRVELRGEGLTIATGPSTLRLFDVRPDASRPLLVLAPHPDDAEIAAFGLYATSRATVATITAGNAGPPTYEAVFGEGALEEQYGFKGRLRVIDSITVPLQGGVPPERALNLGYFDTRLAAMFEAPEQATSEKYGTNTDIGAYRQYNLSPLAGRGPRQATWRNLVADIEALLRRVEPAVIVAPHPQLDAHGDHGLTTVALVEAMSRWHRKATLLLYTNHADGNRYPYGPAGTLVSLPPVAQPVEIDRVFSLPIPAELQRRKLFALESMHDLRYSPTRQYQLAIGEGRTLQPEAPGPDPAANLGYLRRGPRSNELFVVYDQDSVRPVIEAFVSAWRAKRATMPAAQPAVRTSPPPG